MRRKKDPDPQEEQEQFCRDILKAIMICGPLKCRIAVLDYRRKERSLRMKAHKQEHEHEHA